MKKILFAASEAVPFIKTGGLADVVGSLPKYFNKDEYDVRVMLPKYACMKDVFKDQLVYNTHYYMDFNSQKKYWKTPKNKTVRHRFASRMPQNPGALKRLHKCV